MSLSEREEAEVTKIAELEVRRYFDHYLKEVFPDQVNQMIRIHNLSPKAHGGVERRFAKAFWLVAGFGAAGGGTVAGLTKLFGGGGGH